MNKKDALDFIDHLRYIVESEHDMTVNHSTSTSESTYTRLENQLTANLIDLAELERYVNNDYQDIAECVMDALCEDGRGDILLLKNDRIREWWGTVLTNRKNKEQHD